MPKQYKSIIIISLLVGISLLFASIVGYYWLRGQHYKFLNQRAQLLLEVNKIEGFDLQRIDLLKQQALTPENIQSLLRLESFLKQKRTYQSIILLKSHDKLITDIEQKLSHIDLTVARRRQDFVTGLRSRVETFNQLVSSHLYLRYFKIPILEIKDN